LKVTMLSSVASHWLIPRALRILGWHPGVDTQVIADPRLLDLRAVGLDLAIRFGRAPHSGHLAMRLMGDRVIPVCTPELVR
jgi:LysR family transcriptional regulator, glycine cleavage system transcriptional activator